LAGGDDGEEAPEGQTADVDGFCKQKNNQKRKDSRSKKTEKKTLNH
jgi:hypothetical protein